MPALTDSPPEPVLTEIGALRAYLGATLPAMPGDNYLGRQHR